MNYKKIFQLNILKFVYLNFLSKHVTRDSKCYIFPYKGTVIEFRKNSKIVLKDNLHVCIGKVRNSRKEAYIQLYDNSTLTILGNVTLAYEAMLQAHHDSYISIGKCNINSYAAIIADKRISIGHDVLISRFVTIFDSDFHPVIDDDGNRINEPQEVILEDHTWIGVKSTILRGVTVKSGAVVGANALVSADVKESTMVSAIPARAFGIINWKSK